MKIGLANQVIVLVNTKQCFLNRKQESWKVLTQLVPTEIAAPQAEGRSDSKGVR